MFELQTVTYGTACAFFLAIRAMQKLAYANASTYPVGSTTIINNFYVDDLLSGANTELEGRILRDETISILQQEGFQLRKWASNCPELEDIPRTDTCELIHFIKKEQEIYTLGMHWNATNDEFQYDINVSNHNKVTKRIMLSTMSKIFNPLGLLGPITLTAKILIQKVWQLDLAWMRLFPWTFTRHGHNLNLNWMWFTL